nr:MAG TPA: hypothetical protein [Caudoviricetes sp.]
MISTYPGLRCHEPRKQAEFDKIVFMWYNGVSR